MNPKEKAPKYKVGKEVNIKGSKTIGRIVSIEFDEEIKQYTYEVFTEAKVHYTVCESEIEENNKLLNKQG
jgi:predicted O-methyltransferase YrrM